jgi:hypothetical protein
MRCDEMNNIKSITLRVNQMNSILTSIQWEPLRQNAILEFSDDSPEQEKIFLHLNGIHFFATRQSLLGGPHMNHPSERRVDFFEIFRDSPFLRQFLNDEVRFCGQIFIYDSCGCSIGEQNFMKPLHVNVNYSDGILDVICESVSELPYDKTGK